MNGRLFEKRINLTDKKSGSMDKTGNKLIIQKNLRYMINNADR